MRITPLMIFGQLTSSLDKTLKNYADLNNELSSGKKINAPSDDPSGILRDLDYKVSINANTQYSRNIETATTSLNMVSTVLSQVSTTIGDINQLVTNDSRSMDATTQATDSAQAAGYRDLLYSLGNTKMLDQYMFSGLLSSTQSFAAGTYAYQGDAGLVNVPIGPNKTMASNMPGSSAFSYTLPAATSVTLASGEIVHYTPGAGTTVDVEIRASDDTTVLDTFSFSNVIQMTDTLSSAISTNNTLRIKALATPFNAIQNQVQIATTDVSQRVASLSTQSTLLDNNSSTLQSAVSSLEEADQLSVIAQLKTAEVTLSVLRDSASRVLSQSLFDFLK